MQTVVSRFIDLAVSRIDAKKTPPPPKAVILPEEDDIDEVADLGDAEGQSFMIEYRDSKGRVSSRRITVWSIKAGPGGIPSLVAKCHERNANRQFRVDRILSCIDYDGEVFEDIPAFLSETFGMHIEIANRKRDSADEGDWQYIRSVVRPHAILLAALSHSDGVMRDAEVEVAVDHCARLSDARGFPVSCSNLKSLAAYIRRQRPSIKAIQAACDEILASNPIEITNFLIAAVALMDADGTRHPEEIALINELSTELTGTGIV